MLPIVLVIGVVVTNRIGTFNRDVFAHAPQELGASNACRFWKLNAPAFGLDDAPVASHRSLQKPFVNLDLFIAQVGLQYTVSSFDPRFIFVFRKEGGAVGAFTTQ